jgi:hypothetical protein
MTKSTPIAKLPNFQPSNKLCLTASDGGVILATVKINLNLLDQGGDNEKI